MVDTRRGTSRHETRDFGARDLTNGPMSRGFTSNLLKTKSYNRSLRMA